MWNNKLKAITLSFDDGCQQDKKLLELLNKYNLKCTFNLNSGLSGVDGSFPMLGKMITRHIVKLDDIHDLYKGHEIAVHSYTHPNLCDLSKDDCIFQLNEDEKLLNSIGLNKMIGMAYPGGTYNDKVIKIIKENTDLKYARPATFYPAVNPGFDLPKDPYVWHMFYWLDSNVDFDKLIDEFLSAKTDKPMLLAIWGHSYEADAYDGLWEKWEKLFKKMSNHDDIFYGTNAEILGYKLS